MEKSKNHITMTKQDMKPAVNESCKQTTWNCSQAKCQKMNATKEDAIARPNCNKCDIIYIFYQYYSN